VHRKMTERVRLDVPAGLVQAVHMTWKGGPHGNLVVRLIKALYNRRTERTTFADFMGSDLMGAHTVLGAVLKETEPCSLILAVVALLWPCSWCSKHN